VISITVSTRLPVFHIDTGLRGYCLVFGTSEDFSEEFSTRGPKRAVGTRCGAS